MELIKDRSCDFIIYTLPETLEHKKRDGRRDDGRFCFWKFSKLPKRIQEDEWSEDIDGIRMYFATKGFINGYFELQDMGMDTHLMDNEVTFYSESWHDITPIPITHFQGFKYADKVEELKTIK